MGLPTNILVPVDFGPPSLRACERAVTLARDLGARLVLLHVIDAPEYTLLPDVRGHTAVERKMGILANGLRNAGATVETRIVEGSPWRSVVLAIETEHVDLVVCGTHNRQGLALIAPGSVAERVGRADPVPGSTARGRRGGGGTRWRSRRASPPTSRPRVARARGRRDAAARAVAPTSRSDRRQCRRSRQSAARR